jgi:hypothetical protein
VSVFFLDPDVVVPHSYVKLSEQLLSVELFNEFGDKGEGVSIGYCILVELLVILYYPIVIVFLFDEECG